MTKSKFTPCNGWSEELAIRADGLSLSNRVELEAHIASCPTCSLAHTDYRMISNLISSLPAPDFPIGLPSQILQIWEEEDRVKDKESQTSDSLFATLSHTLWRNKELTHNGGERITGDKGPAELVPPKKLHPLYLCWHKAMDITFGILGMIMLITILPVLALLIYLDSPGPIFYMQERVGHMGRKFHVYKLRTMRIDVENTAGDVWVSREEARLTRAGRFLRITHLDELPQVLNILKGDMSLIGPRPEREQIISEMEKVVPSYRCRLSIKPGLTGWAQVKYPSMDTKDDELVRLQYDFHYITHQSFMLDIVIILKTALEVLLYKGEEKPTIATEVSFGLRKEVLGIPLEVKGIPLIAELDEGIREQQHV